VNGAGKNAVLMPSGPGVLRVVRYKWCQIDYAAIFFSDFRKFEVRSKSDICGIISARLVTGFKSSRIRHNYTLRFCHIRLL
jgi:hypothetical protein